MFNIVGIALPLLVLALQQTVGESSALVYASMYVPTAAWAALPIVLAVLAAAKRSHAWLAAHLAVAAAVLLIQGGYNWGSPRRSEAASLRVMTLNVQLFRDHDVAKVAAEIIHSDADVIMLQELPKDASVDPFIEHLPGYRIERDGRLGILTRFPLEETYTWHLTESRRMMGAKINVSGRSVLFLNVHLQHFPSDQPGKIADASRQLVEETAALMETLHSVSPGPIVLGGDFNSVPSARIHRMLREVLADCFAETSRGYGYTLPARAPFLRVDYLYVGGGVEPLRSYVSASTVSDHRAVITDLLIAD